jgi:di/tricarboxylate transporter
MSQGRASEILTNMTDRTARPAPAQILRLTAIAAIIPLLGIAPWLSGGSPVFVRAGVLVACCIAAWATGFLAEPIASLLFFMLAAAFEIAPPTVIFSGFTTPAWWLVFGGAITTMAVERTSLTRHLSGLLHGSLVGSYRRALTATAMLALGLAFFLPSSATRVIFLLPVVLGFADRLGFAPGRPGRGGLVMTAVSVTVLAAVAILPANISNLVLVGAADTLYGIKVTYGAYSLLHFPVLGLLKTLMLIEVSYRLFPERGPLPRSAPEIAAPLSANERTVACILLVSLVLFMTDWLHGVSPAWVALGAGIVCLLPGIGVLPANSLSEMNLGMLIYMAGIFGVGAVIATTGLGSALSGALLRVAAMAPGHDALNLTLIAGIGAAIGFVTTLVGMPVVLAPLAGDFAHASGLPVLTVLMLQVVIFSTVFLPYQNFLMVIGMQYGGVGLKSGTRFCLTQAAVTVVVLCPLDYLWWWWLGYLP